MQRLIILIEGIDQKLTQIVELLSRSTELETIVWLDNQEVMRALKISVSTLRRRRLEGTIPSTRISGKFYYKESDIQEALKKNWS